MPALEVCDLNDDAVLWPVAGNADPNGQDRVSDRPVGVRVRWNDSFTEVRDPQGNTVAIEATVVADRRIDKGSVLWHGKVSDLPAGTGFALEDVPDLMQVYSWNGTQSLNGRNTRHELKLMRLKSSLPGTVSEPDDGRT